MAQRLSFHSHNRYSAAEDAAGVREAERLYLAAGQAEIDARHEERDGEDGGGGGGYMDGMDLPPMDSESDEYEYEDDANDDANNDGASDEDSCDKASKESAASADGGASLGAGLDTLQLQDT